MSDVSKHHSKQKWESNASEKSGIYLLIYWDSVSINNFLEQICKFIQEKKSWRLEIILIDFFDSENLF